MARIDLHSRWWLHPEDPWGLMIENFFPSVSDYNVAWVDDITFDEATVRVISIERSDDLTFDDPTDNALTKILLDHFIVFEGDNLVTNPSFELGDPPTSWTLKANTTFAQNSDAYLGDYSGFVISLNGSGRGVYQRVLLSGALNRSFRLSAWHKNSVGNTGWMALTTGNEVCYKATGPLNDAEWTRYEIETTATQDTLTVFLYAGMNTGDACLWDGVVVEEIRLNPVFEIGKNIKDDLHLSEGDNLVSNGGMETGDPPTGWTAINAPETFEQSSTQKHSGSYSAHVVDDPASYGGFRQSQSWTIGKTYKLSFWYYLVAGTLQVGIVDNDDTFMQGDGVGGNSYKTYTTTGSWRYGEVTGASDGVGSSGLIRIINHSNSVAAEFYIDDVRIEEIRLNPVFVIGKNPSDTITFDDPTAIVVSKILTDDLSLDDLIVRVTSIVLSDSLVLNEDGLGDAVHATGKWTGHDYYSLLTYPGWVESDELSGGWTTTQDQDLDDYFEDHRFVQDGWFKKNEYWGKTAPATATWTTTQDQDLDDYFQDHEWVKDGWFNKKEYWDKKEYDS